MNALLNQCNGATVILFKAESAKQLPSKSDLKIQLKVKEVNFYERDGIHDHDISMLEFALGVAREPIELQRLPTFPMYLSTDVLIMDPGVSSIALASVNHESIVIEGFNLNESCLYDLKPLCTKYFRAINVRMDAVDWINSAQANADLYACAGMDDSSATELSQLKNFAEDYGVLDLNTAKAEIAEWVSQYSWR